MQFRIPKMTGSFSFIKQPAWKGALLILMAVALIVSMSFPQCVTAEVSQAENTPDPSARITKSQFNAPGYPSPDVPECPRAEDAAFQGAVLIGASTAEPFDLLDGAPPLTTLSSMGLSPSAALQSKFLSLNYKKMTLQDVLAIKKPTAIYIWLGINGLDYHSPEEVIIDYELLLDRIITICPTTPIYLMALTPVKTKLAERKHLLTNKNVLDYNARLLELAKKYNVYFLPIYSFFCDANGDLSDEYGTGDGLHLRSAAYRLLFDYLYTHVIPAQNPNQGGN